MHKLFVAAVICTFSVPTWSEFVGDIYKCGSEYTNVYDGPSRTITSQDLINLGCKRVKLASDPVSVNGKQQATYKIGKDGHFHINGEINGRPIAFLVDTGATTVSVSPEFARRANLRGGKPASFSTANGTVKGEVFENVIVSAGGFEVKQVSVSNALQGSGSYEGLLGQSFLSRFEVTMDDQHLVLRNKKQ